MAVALATLPLNRVLAGAGDTLFLTAATGAGLAAGFTAGLAAALTGLTAGFAACFAGAGAFLATDLVTGFAGAFLAALLLGLTLLGAAFLTAIFLAAAFFGAGFFATTFFATTLFTGAFFMAAFFTAAFFAGPAFFAGDFAAAFLATGLATGLRAVTDLAAAFFAALTAGFAALRLVFADVLPALTARPLPAAVFDLPALASCALAGALPFCALAAVELRVVFAISLHRFWPWRPGVIAHVSHTSKLASGILVPLPAASRSGTVNILTRFILWLLRLYKRWLSPLFGQRCRFYPSCSDYARIAVIRFGPWRGSLLAGWRLLRCQPLCEGGNDPVPGHFHYPRCRCRQDPHGRH